MIQTKLAKQYAKALFEYALCENKSDLVEKEMKALGELEGKSLESLKAFFYSPIFSCEKKIELSCKIFEHFSEVFLRFIKLLISSKRENLLLNIASEYKKLVYKNKEILEASFTSAFILDEKLKNKIENKVNLILKAKEFLFTYQVDSSLLGGGILQIEDKRLDFSLKNKFAALRNTFVNTRNT